LDERVPTADEIRESQRATWADLSVTWEKWDALIMEQLRPAGTAIIDALGVADDQVHLDIASGTGEPGLTVAAMAPRGRVVLTDLSPEMLEVAKRRAAAQGIANVDTRVCDAADLPFDDASFDSVSVRFGYMFFPDTAATTAELVRVLKPGGRIAATVWIKPEENPWTSVAMQAITAEVTLPPPDPNGPSMFRCAEPGYVSALYKAAGLHDVDEWDVPLELVTESPEEYWDVIRDHLSFAAAALQQLDESARQRIQDTVLTNVSAYEVDGKVRVPGMARCVVGTK
jgi:SAM-dependent methyltransferase